MLTNKTPEKSEVIRPITFRSPNETAYSSPGLREKQNVYAVSTMFFQPKFDVVSFQQRTKPGVTAPNQH